MSSTNQVIKMRTNENGVETAMVQYDPFNTQEIVASTFASAKISRPISTTNINVSDWQAAAEEDKILFGFVRGFNKVEIVEQKDGLPIIDPETGEPVIKILDSVLVEAFFSCDGTMPKGKTAQLYIIAQYRAVKDLQQIGINNAFAARYIGSKMHGIKNIHQFSTARVKTN